MNIGLSELIITLVIVLIIFGPGRIASLGRELGATFRQFRQGLEIPQKGEPGEQESPDDQE